MPIPGKRNWRLVVVTMTVFAVTAATTSEAIVVRHGEDSTVLSVDFGRAYDECTAPNTMNSVAIPACAPPVTSSCTFAGGVLRVQRHNISANELEMNARIDNVAGPGSCPSGPYTLQLRMRITIDDTACASGACTLVDVPVSIPLVQNGNDFRLVDYVLESAFPGPISQVASYEILGAVVLGSDGLPMAAGGADADGADVKADFTVAYDVCTAPDTANAWGVPACSAPIWPSPCDYRAGEVAITNGAPGTRLRTEVEDLVGAPSVCSDGTYTLLPNVRITTSDCGMPCTLVDLQPPLPITVERGDTTTLNSLLASALPFLQSGDTVELRDVSLQDPLGNRLAPLGTTSALRLFRARFFAGFRDSGNPNDDKVTIKGRVAALSIDKIFRPLDPTVGGVTFTASDKDGVVYTATIPAAAWQVYQPGRKWRYKDELGTINGVFKAEVTETRHNGTPNGYKLQLIAKDTDASAANLPAVDVVITASTPSGGSETASSGTICKVSSRRVSCK